MIYSNCGQTLDNSAKFCVQCGTTVKALANPFTESTHYSGDWQIKKHNSIIICNKDILFIIYWISLNYHFIVRRFTYEKQNNNTYTLTLMYDADSM